MGRRMSSLAPERSGWKGPALSKRNVSLSALVVVIVLCVGTVTGIAQIAATTYSSPSLSQIQGPIADADAVTLYGNVHPLARSEYDRGAVDPGLRLKRIVLLLQPSPDRLAAAANLAAAQQNPASPYYHKWLTNAEYGARFGASADDVAKVQGWLQSHGFSVEPVAYGRRAIYFSGTAAQVSSAFHTELHNYQVNGVHHVANVQNPQIPLALAPVVSGIVSLHDFRYQSYLRSRRLAGKPQNTGTLTGSVALFPADFGVIYDLTSTWGTSYAGNTGKGVTIGIVGRSNIVLSDIATFESSTNLPSNVPTVDLAGNGNVDPGLVSGDQTEATLDVEWSDAVAPGASILLAPAASVTGSGGVVTTDGVDLSASYLVNKTNPPQVISVSYGSCEQNMGATELAFFDSLWQQAALQGQSVFVASGDSGAAGCEAGNATAGTQAAVNGLCSSAYATCVGGTMFNDTGSPSTYWNSTNNGLGASAKSYIPEAVWNESALNGGAGLWASGGGISLAYALPTWQSVATGTAGQRGVPDVALTAALHDGYVGYETIGSASSWYSFSGTSAATPAYAAIIALVSKANGAAPQGNVNPILYGLAASSTNGSTGSVAISVRSVDSAKVNVVMASTAPSGVTVAFTAPTESPRLIPISIRRPAPSPPMGRVPSAPSPPSTAAPTPSPARPETWCLPSSRQMRRVSLRR